MENQKGELSGEPGHWPVIPTPPGIRWQEFRAKYLPPLVFLTISATIWQLWQVLPAGNGLRGIGEGQVSILASPQDGFLDQVHVLAHSPVATGQPLVTILPFDPASHLALFQSRLQVSRLALEPSMAARNAVDYERLRIEGLRLKQELAMARANLERAEKVLPRHATLLEERLISRDIYDLSLRDRDYYAAEVREKSRASEEIDARIEQLTSVSQVPSADSKGAVLPELETAMASMQTNWNPITLHAPIDGEVLYYRQGHEFVSAGEWLLTVRAAKADRVIAYLRQPFPFEPVVGMTMEVTTRSKKPQRFITEIAQVGSRVEPITNAIAYLQPGLLVDAGLPLILPVPESVHVRPGEVVDVVWKQPGAQPGWLERIWRREARR